MHETSYIITYRAADDPARRANLEAMLSWLKLQPLAEVIVVEQEAAPTLGDLASFPGLRSLFAYNPGPFNKSWGFNVGVRASKGSLLAFGDADMLCRALADGGGCGAIRRAGGPGVFKGYRSRRGRVGHAAGRPFLLGDPTFGVAPTDRTESGEIPLCGRLELFQRQFLALVGGWDEQFFGWGGEDDAMDIKVRRSGLRGVTLKESPGFATQLLLHFG